MCNIVTLCNVVQEIAVNIAQEKSGSMFSQYSLDNIAQVNDLCNAILEAPKNNAQKKILFDVVLILLGQHSAGKNLMQVSQETPGNIE